MDSKLKQAMVCAMLTYFIPSSVTALKVGYVASIASKLSDTLGSELVSILISTYGTSKLYMLNITGESIW